MEVKDIDTQQARPAILIDNTDQLRDVVYEIASLELILRGAENQLQAKIEAAKKAYDEATREATERVNSLFAAVEAYATEHRDELFPVKKGKRVKTYKVLEHKLQYRSSDSVQAPANAVDIIKAIIANSEVNIMNLGPCDAATQIAAGILKLEGCIRQPAPELNKDAVKAIDDQELVNHLATHGIRVATTETFKLAFSFTPDDTES
jgi:phage host-nuclease inhibitor protein Gam